MLPAACLCCGFIKIPRSLFSIRAPGGQAMNAPTRQAENVICNRPQNVAWQVLPAITAFIRTSKSVCWWSVSHWHFKVCFAGHFVTFAKFVFPAVYLVTCLDTNLRQYSFFYGRRDRSLKHSCSGANLALTRTWCDRFLNDISGLRWFSLAMNFVIVFVGRFVDLVF